ncbi:hypothetical protein FCV82_17790 [Vibrio breoganii]|uniref:hypothetical protein n=1 Tax=Vibrio breoganii TaxID=553239 RepID=UPI0010BE0DD6|nr:hypothetical protein [Vibrio breoganii]TKF84209.1 hypothetical protein FCV82_17790 [Vibrio breoganii]
MSAELGTHHYQVDTLKSQNLAALYVSCDRVLIGSVTTSLLKRALEQCKKLNVKEALLLALIALHARRELGLYKDTGAKHPICTVAIELDADGMHLSR